jgi:hypothetical protein
VGRTVTIAFTPLELEGLVHPDTEPQGAGLAWGKIMRVYGGKGQRKGTPPGHHRGPEIDLRRKAS